MNPSNTPTPTTPAVPCVTSTPDATQKRLRHLAAEQRRSQKTARGPVTDAIVGWLANRYLDRTYAQLSAPDQPLDLLRNCVRDFSRIRRDDLAAGRLQVARERTADAHFRSEAQKEKEFRRWLKRPDIREELFPKAKGGITRETLSKIERELNLL
jgi:hypothetical protein